MSGKAEKQEANEKAKKNGVIKDHILAYYLKYQEMPEYIAEVGAGVGQRYASELNQAFVHIGMIQSNMRQMYDVVDKSSLSKKAKEEITQWLKVSINEEVRENAREKENI